MNLRCRLNAIWLNIRYFKILAMEGLLAEGHKYDYKGETSGDKWIFECDRCGAKAASEIDPAKIKERENYDNS